MEHSADTAEFFDLSHSGEPASYYYLLLDIRASRVKACWYHATKNLVTGFADYAFNGDLKALVNQHPYLRSEFKEVVICMHDSNYLLYPKHLVDGAQPDIFSITNSFDPQRQMLLNDSLVNIKSDIAYVATADLVTDIHDQFNHVKLISHITPRIEQELNVLKTRSDESTLASAHISDEQIDLRYYRNGALLAANSYYQSCAEDIAYYVLYAAELLNIDPETTPLSLSGDIAMGDQAWNLLSKYWRTLKAVQALQEINISADIPVYPGTEYDYLTHSLLCVS